MNTTRTPVREIVAYLGIAYSLALTVALALPDAHLNLLLSVAVPTVTVGILTFTLTPKGSRRALWRGIGLGRAGFKAWPAAIALPFVLCAGAYGTALVIGAGRAEGLQPGRRDAQLGDRPGPVAADRDRDHRGRGDRVARVPAAPLPAAHQQEARGGRDRVLPRLLPPAADPARDDVRHRRLEVGRRTGGGGRDHRRWRVLRLGLGPRRTVWPVAIAHNVVNTVFDLGAASVIAVSGWNMAVRRRRDRVRHAGGLRDRRGGAAERARVWREPGFEARR